MSLSQERKTLARLSVAAGSAMTLAAAWLGVLEVERPTALPDGAEASLARSQDALSSTTLTPAAAASQSSTPTIPVPTPGVGGVTETATPAATATARTVVTPAATSAPAPTPRIVTRRSRAS